MNKLVAALVVALGCSQAFDTACSPEALDITLQACEIRLSEAASECRNEGREPPDCQLYAATLLSCEASVRAWGLCK